MIDLNDKIRVIKNYPKEGECHYDITPLLKDPKALQDAIKYFAIRFKGRKIDKVVAIEGHGFTLGATLAYMLGVGFVPIRRPNKLPADIERIDYALEFGTDSLEIHKDALESGEKVLLVNDQLATGGTARAAIQLVENLGGEVIECAFLIGHTNLNGKERLKDYNIFTMLDLE
jgi:adenine phosphoribosyltransferase